MQHLHSRAVHAFLPLTVIYSSVLSQCHYWCLGSSSEPGGVLSCSRQAAHLLLKVWSKDQQLKYPLELQRDADTQLSPSPVELDLCFNKIHAIHLHEG